MMRKTIAGLMGCLLLTATAARAEHKLLITDVLDAKQIEALATFEYARTQQSFDAAFIGGGRGITNTTESRYSLGAGLGYGLEVTASIPYVFSESTKVEFNNPFLEPEYEKKDGFGDFSFGAKYGILEEKKKAPVSLVAGVDVKFETGGRNTPGTGTTDVSPYLAVSKKVGHHVIPYAAYRATIRNHGAEDSHILSLGSENEINETVTIDARVDAVFNTATNELSSFETYDLELSSYVQLFHNFYVIPAVTLATGSTAHTKDIDIHFGSPFEVKAGASLYYLF